MTRSEYSRLVNGKAHTVSARTQGVVYGWDSITDFDIENFVVRLRNYASETDRDIVRQTDIDADGNRIGSVGGACKAEVGNRLGGTQKTVGETEQFGNTRYIWSSKQHSQRCKTRSFCDTRQPICLWAEVAPDSEKEQREIDCFGTL